MCFLKVLLAVFSWSIFIRTVIDHMTCYNLNWSKIKLSVHYFIISCGFVNFPMLSYSVLPFHVLTYVFLYFLMLPVFPVLSYAMCSSDLCCLAVFSYRLLEVFRLSFLWFPTCMLFKAFPNLPMVSNDFLWILMVSYVFPPLSYGF